MSILQKVKVTVSAPKTKDEQYEEARLLFKTHALSASKFSSSIRALVRLSTDLSNACVKASNDYCEWATSEGAGSEITSEARQVLVRAQQYRDITEECLLPKLQPHFISHLELYEQEVANIHKMKVERNKLMKEYDKARELLRLLENDKKPKPDKIDAARVRSDECLAKYEAANKLFIDSVHRLNEERRKTLGDPFKSLAAIFCQYFTKIGSGSSTSYSFSTPSYTPPPKTEAHYDPPYEATPTPAPVATPTPAPAPEPEPAPAPTPAPAPAPADDPWATPAQQPTPADDPWASPKVEPTPEPTPEPVAVRAADPPPPANDDPWAQPAQNDPWATSSQAAQNDPWATSAQAQQDDPWAQPAQNDPWAQPAQSDPWGGSTQQQDDPWGGSTQQQQDPWGGSGTTSGGTNDFQNPFD